jgi:hypothetical protein
MIFAAALSASQRISAILAGETFWPGVVGIIGAPPVEGNLSRISFPAAIG